MDLVKAAKQLLTLKNFAKLQEDFAEPFARGLSPIPVEKLPFIGGNFHKPKQNMNTRASTAVGLALQSLIGGAALSPLKLAKGGTLAKALGPNISKVASGALRGARYGGSFPAESSDFNLIGRDRLAGIVGGGISGGIGYANPFVTRRIPLNQGGRTVGFISRKKLDPLNLARDVLATSGGVEGYLRMKGQ